MIERVVSKFKPRSKATDPRTNTGIVDNIESLGKVYFDLFVPSDSL